MAMQFQKKPSHKILHISYYRYVFSKNFDSVNTMMEHLLLCFLNLEERDCKNCARSQTFDKNSKPPTWTVNM